MESRVALLPQQDGLLYQSMKYDINNTSYTVQICFEFTCNINIQKLLQAWELIFKRHEIFRSNVDYSSSGGIELQLNDDTNMNVQLHDYQRLDSNIKERKLSEFLATDLGTGFDVFTAPLHRFNFFQLSEERSMLVWSYHHILLGGDSVRVIQEVFACYEFLLSNAIENYPVKQTNHYKSVVNSILSKDKSAAKNYWQNILLDFKPTPIEHHQLKATEPRTEDKIAWHLPKELFNQVETFLKNHAIKPHVFFQAVIGLSLSPLLRSNDFCLGCVRGFPSEEVDDLVGMFFSVLPIRLMLDPGKNIFEFISGLHDQNKALRKYFYSSILDIHECCEIDFISPIYNVIYDFKKVSVSDALKENDNYSDNVSIQFKVKHDYMMLLEVMQSENAFSGYINYDIKQFSKSEINMLLDGLFEIIGRVTQPDCEDLQQANPALLSLTENAAQEISYREKTEQSSMGLNFVVYKKLKGIFANVLDVEPESITEDSDFFELGGHSILALKIALSIKTELDVNVKVTDIYQNNVIQELSHFVAHHIEPSDIMGQDAHQNPINEFPASSAQKRFWVLDEQLKNGYIYNSPCVFKIKGKISQDTLQQALLQIMQRHEALRTVFYKKNSKLYQKILKIKQIELEFCDLQENLSAVREKISSDAKWNFDLSQAEKLLVRCHLYQIESEEYFLLINIHHINIDAWSIEIIQNELVLAYEALQSNKEAKLNIVDAQQKEFAQYEIHNFKKHQEQLKAWVTYLEDIVNLEYRPISRVSEIKPYQGAQYEFSLDKSESDQLIEIAKANSTTLYAVLLTAYSLLLHKLSKQSAYCIGVPITNREHPKFQNTVGLILNTLPLKQVIDEHSSFNELLAYNHQQMNFLHGNASIPFDEIVSAINPERSDANPIFQTIYVQQHVPKKSSDQNLITIDRESIDWGIAKFPLSLYTTIGESGIELCFEYQFNYFDAYAIKTLKEIFIDLIANIIKHPESHVSALNQSATSALIKIEGTEKHNPSKSFIDKFHSVTTNYPQKIAIREGEAILTYNQFYEKVSEYKHYLMSNGVSYNDVVIVTLPISLDLVICMVAIWELGAIYQPLDENISYHRLGKIIASSGAKFIIDKETSETIKFSQITELYLPSDSYLCGQEIKQTSNSFNTHAYVIYTSGSSGEPKGILIQHSSLLNTLDSVIDYLQLDSNTRIVAITPPHFDVSIAELLLTFCVGGELIISPRGTAQDASLLSEQMTLHEPCYIFTTPSTWRAYLNYMGSEQLLEHENVKCICTGEKLKFKLANKLFNTFSNVYNFYGPSEATIWSSLHTISEHDIESGVIPIGQPVDNSSYYIETDLFNYDLCVGQLFIAGAGLLKQYISETKIDHIVPESNSHPKLYATGDLVKLHDNNKIEYLGRIDRQFKIDGKRVEPAEIEMLLNQHPGIYSAFVMHLQDAQQLNALLSFAVLNNNVFEDSSFSAENWRQIWEASYATHHDDSGFVGWASKLDKQDFSDDTMNAWLNEIILKIIDLNPKSILDVGCGNGAVMKKLAAKVNHYHGLDFSETAISELREYSEKHMRECERITLNVQDMVNLDQSNLERYDTIILNSVVQYIPSASDLTSLLTKLIEHVDDDGVIFIGDVRNYDYLEEYYRDYSKNLSIDNVEPLTLEILMANENELLLSPRFFTNFATTHSRISHVKLMLKQGDYHDELSKYRFDVCLYLNKNSEPLQFIEHKYKSLPELKQLVSEGIIQDDVIKIKDIPNRSFCDDTNAVYPYEIRNALMHSRYLITISPSQIDKHNKMDVILSLNVYPGFSLSYYHTIEKNIPMYNKPIEHVYNLEVSRDIKQSLRDKLPEYMVPSIYYFIESLPRTKVGKLDYTMLERVHFQLSNLKSITVRSNSADTSSPTIEKIRSAFCKVLNNNLITEDSDFFESGGYSFLAIKLVNEINEDYGLPITLSDIFLFRTPRALGNTLNQIETNYSETA